MRVLRIDKSSETVRAADRARQRDRDRVRNRITHVAKPHAYNTTK